MLKMDKQKTTNTTTLSGAPMTAAAFLLPFLTISSIFLMLMSARIEIPRFWAYIPFSLCIGCSEIVSGVFLSERGKQTTVLAEVRRHIIASAIILGISMLLTGKDNFLFAPITFIYVIQWLVTNKIRKMSGSLEILMQYAGKYKEEKLAQRMRDTMEEARLFHQTNEKIHIITLIFLIIQFGFAFISLLLGYPLSWAVVLVLVLSAAIHFLLKYFIRHLSESQALLHEGLKVSQQINRYRTTMALVIIVLSLIAALLISPGWSLFPPGTLAAWLNGLIKVRSVHFEPPKPVDILAPESPGFQEMLKNIPQKDPVFRLDIFFRLIGIAGLIVIIFLIIKPFLLPTFYRSIKSFHPFKRLLSALKRFFYGVINTAGDFVQFIREAIAGSNDKKKTQLEAWGIPGSFMGKNVTRKKRQEWNKVIHALLSLVNTAESQGIRYRKFEGPGTFITRLKMKILENHDTATLSDQILMRLNSVFYSPTALPGRELQELLHDMKQLGKGLQPPKPQD